MAKAKKKRLPKDFEELLKRKDLVTLKAVFDTCEIDARGGYSDCTALAFTECPDELAQWLVDNGADINATDKRGATPLHARARYWKGGFEVLLTLGANVNADADSIGTPLHAAADSHKPKNAALLIAHGAKVNARNREGLTPLELALRGCSNADLDQMAPLAHVLLDAGAEKTPAMKQSIKEIGERFEFHRSGFNPESVDAANAALEELYRLFDVSPAQRRMLYDGKSPIRPTSTTWQKQHEELWNLLVPSSGFASTVQGEVIRIAGRISDELERNGGANWDKDYRTMAKAFLTHVRTGTSLSPELSQECEAIVNSLIKDGSGDTARLAEFGVSWVLLNPQPFSHSKPEYKR